MDYSVGECGLKEVQPSTSSTHDKGRKRSHPQGESSEAHSPVKKPWRDTTQGTNSEQIVLNEVKKIMEQLKDSLNKEDGFHVFLKKKIKDLKRDKREVVGVFGETGAGKSSLINAIIGKKDLLPSGRVSACTAVMIKLEFNMCKQNNEAEIEFIPKEEWEEELRYVSENKTDQEDEEDEYYCDIVEKLSAFYGEEWKNIPAENLMDRKHFREIPEFLNSRRKILPCRSVQDLSEKVVKYTRNGSSDKKGGEVKKWYWPLVKCVTLRVPSYDLHHVTLVDLPGSGDNNKSRDRMWTEVVKSCSTVWIVTEINRAPSKKETWDILESASSLMGNGGECQQILFICTKSDVPDSSTNGREEIIQRNIETKEAVKSKFNKTKKIKKHFGDECLEVFTVSSQEFLQTKLLEPEDTEIPKLQEFLRNLNDNHSETLNYVSGALGILSMIQGARSGAVTDTKTKLRSDLEKKLNELDEIRKPMEETYKAFEKCLTEGVEESETSCEKLLNRFLYPRQQTGRGFHKILKSVAKNGGIYKPKKGKQININVLLASPLTDSIEEEFKKTFPNERKLEPFNGIINTFSLGTEGLTEKYKGVELQLTFLKTEEEKIKTELSKYIREEKKKIYTGLTETIQDTMQKCYEEAAGFTGPGTLENMRKTLEKHVCDSKNIMFKQAKYTMLEQLKELMEYVLKKLDKTLKESIELSQTDDQSLPDVSAQLEQVEKYYHHLKDGTDQTEVDDMDTEASGDQTSPSEENPERNIPPEKDVPGEKKLFKIRTQFIDRVSEPNLDKLLDELLQHRVINDGEMQAAREMTKANKGQELVDMVRRKGSKASEILISALCEVDPFLSKELNLM
ncbi:Nuclear GTPase SLIP-GC [Channa argus]|uniref:Nuclear GTPase SLIP-GC n=1 Tax=Channa argus TaxID=215402 RepID=A0A6G1QN70_CHAAH|nr:Nuclear GTPase SLIP-GC [Channa argus]